MSLGIQLHLQKPPETWTCLLALDLPLALQPEGRACC